ncbi:hypothetical protein BV898_03534 [Hypsibius exemplaris]|uniref:Uncharacterized protein n=1 Tax=Hypsibius exemplaris TaxID=2072580 RepID=A0A1W0X5D6_HYPEX|nr:hypothetical protein BV898_03534 [Hypsibius exemplaris]
MRLFGVSSHAEHFVYYFWDCFFSSRFQRLLEHPTKRGRSSRPSLAAVFANCCGHNCNDQDMLVADANAQGNCWCKPANKCFTDNGGTRRSS